LKLDPTSLALPGCYSFRLPKLNDDRGSFQKLFHQTGIGTLLPNFLPREVYLTNSVRGVLRGMHFQLPPHDHGKLVICLSGHVTDVLLDLRPGRGYGACTSVELTPKGSNAVLLPRGIAHGFYSREDNSALLYMVESVYAPECDKGVRWDSFGFEWPNDREAGETPILSDRDSAHPPLSAFVPPSHWTGAQLK